MKFYHFRSGLPNLEAICVDAYYSGWNPERFSGHMGTGIYCFATLPPIREKSTLYMYEVDPSSFFRAVSQDHEMILEEFSKELLRYVVSTLHQLYGDRVVTAPLHSWYTHYNGPEYKAELLAICDRYCSRFDDTLSRFLRSQLSDRDAFLFDFIRNYSNYIKTGEPLKQRRICDGRRSPFTFLLIRRGHTGLIYGDGVEFFNNQESRGVILFDTEVKPISVTDVDVGWKATYRAALLLANHYPTSNFRHGEEG